MSRSTSPVPSKTPATPPRPAARYARQTVLEGVGPAGQARFAQSHVVIVGAGGLGAPVATALAAAGIGRLTLLDDDVVEASNLNRQTWFTPADIGKPKVEIAAARLRAQNPACVVEAVDERVDTFNAQHWARAGDVLVDAVDGLPAKYMLNDAATATGAWLVHGAVTAWQGQVTTVHGGHTPCVRCLFPAQPVDVDTCETRGVLAAATGLVGNLMALEVHKVLLGDPAVATGRWLAVDVRAPAVRTLRYARDPACPACGPDAIHDGTRAAAYSA